MKPETTEDILELMNGYIASAALGTAMELGLFWLLAKEPLSSTDVAQTLNIPLNRCTAVTSFIGVFGFAGKSGTIHRLHNRGDRSNSIKANGFSRFFYNAGAASR